MTMATKTAKKTAGSSAKASPLSAEERAAARETVAERKRIAAGESGEKMLLEAIAKMKEPDRALAKLVHAIIQQSAPELGKKTWYGMPAYTKDDKVVVFFQDAAKFKARYATLGFQEKANLDDGEMWATSFALKEITPAVEAKIAALVKKAAR
jgi:uncharacterized protein YdhG (YjbR/CyaY superfamily)